MRVLVPFDSRTPKTRLSPVLDDDERHAFARVMLADVLAVLQRAGHDPLVVATGPVDCSTPSVVDERPLTTAVNARLDETPSAVVMADLAMVTTDAIDRLLSADGEVVVAPGIGGGTNALVVRHPQFSVDYHGTSLRDHWERARTVGASVTTVDSFRLSLDVDDPQDLVEVLLHGDGDAAVWLREAGFRLAENDGRTVTMRSGDSS